MHSRPLKEPTFGEFLDLLNLVWCVTPGVPPEPLKTGVTHQTRLVLDIGKLKCTVENLNILSTCSPVLYVARQRGVEAEGRHRHQLQ